MSTIRTITFLALSLFAGVSAYGADIYLAGDSTMCNYHAKQAPQQGWGHDLQDLCVEDVNVVNMALGGRSVKSFRNEKRWEKLLEQLKPGDFVVIQFGHNDGNKTKPERYADHRSEFRELLKTCVEEVREKKAFPILVSPTPRWAFIENDKAIHIGSIGAYASAAKTVAEENDVPFIDLTGFAAKKLVELGPNETKKFYMVAAKNDSLHLSSDGAKIYAKWFVEAVQQQDSPLVKLFRSDIR